ncbi:nuclear transport factor 2 family protein [Tychonema sp. LEGE 07203]|uniref:nuclear transport factor 2 family protein n=1 Tax=Tychonema sp. LEGE 07203 TaxID=1828671 RepID=UPI00187F90A9|nr:nuclear transport factor 2 family protein [Tychonema sp. LEGE 07203]MBE9094353.1 nuclear transport factor 2 family protein [Tychonema sp. LEGE 07203]
MRNLLNLVPSVSQYFCSRRDEKADPLRWRSPRRGGLRQRPIAFGFNCGLSVAQMLLCLTAVTAGVLHPTAVTAIGATPGATPGAIVQTPANAPAPLTKLLTAIDAAANRRDVKAVMAFYSENFTHSDGLNSRVMAKGLTQLWERYPNLNYRTELKSWKTEGSAIVAETVTTITGTQKKDGIDLNLKATIRSQQRFEGEKIVKQEILAEQTQLSYGKNPPTVQVNFPEQVKVGEEYHFDAIVREPIGDDILIGTVLEEPITEKTFFNPSKVELELLNSGGLFKVGTAPATPENRWISAVLMRQGGIATVSVRLRVVK